MGLEPTNCSAPSSSEKSQTAEKIIETESRHLSTKSNQTSLDGQRNNGSSFQVAGLGDIVESTKFPFAGGSDYGNFEQWQLGDMFGISELNQNYNYIDNGSSKVEGLYICSVLILFLLFCLEIALL